jgi:hypothetical protein
MRIWEDVVAITRVLSARGAQLVVATPIVTPSILRELGHDITAGGRPRTTFDS